MKSIFLICLLFVAMMGCGSDGPPDHTQLETMITVIDKDGNEAHISSADLIDPETGKPTVQKVFVIDRQKKKKGFVEASKLQSQDPSAPRYFPVTVDTPSEG